MGLKVLVCGSRDFKPYGLVHAALDELRRQHGINFIINGGAKGADAFAVMYAKNVGIHYATVPALWDKFDKKAGPMRNQAMLTYCLTDICVAFPGGKGTAHMIEICKKNKINIWMPYNDL